MRKKLNARQERFVAEYLRDGNAAQAYVRAGYAPGAAETCGPRLLRSAQVAAAVDKGRSRLTAKLELSAEKVLADIARIATSAEAAEEYSAALKGQELLGKHLKLFADRVEHSGEGGRPIQVLISGVRREPT